MAIYPDVYDWPLLAGGPCRVSAIAGRIASKIEIEKLANGPE